MSTATRRKTWTVIEWTAFVARCRDVQAKLWQAVKAGERIPGYRVSISDTIVRASYRINDGLNACESIVEDDCGIDPMPLIHGPRLYQPTPLPEARFTHLPETRPKRGYNLSLESWLIEGEHIKAVRSDMLDIVLDFARDHGARDHGARAVRPRGYFSRANKDLSRVRTALEALFYSQYPQCYEPACVVFGAPTHAQPGRRDSRLST